MSATTFYGRVISQLSDFDRHEPHFIIATENTRYYMGEDYGPPDPPPQRESVTTVQLTALMSEAEVLEWVTQNANKAYGSPEKFKVFKISPVQIKTEVKLTLG